jgi:hypothetical protein
MIFGLGGLATILFFNVLQAIGFAIVVGVLAYSYLSITNERDSMNFQPGRPLLGNAPVDANPNFGPNSGPISQEPFSHGSASMIPDFARSNGSNTHDFSPFPRPNHAQFNAKALAAMESNGSQENGANAQGNSGSFAQAHGNGMGFGSFPAAQISGAFPAHPGMADATPAGGFPIVHATQAAAITRSVQNPISAINVLPTSTVAAGQANSFEAFPQKSIPTDQVITVPPTQTTSSNPYMRRAHQCWKCKDVLYVYSWPGHHMWSTNNPPQPKPESVQFRFYQTIGAKYWANVCQKCDSVQGDHLVFDEHSPYKWENFS